MTEGRRTYQDLLQERGPLDEYRLIRREVDDGIATITLNDPDSLSSYSARMTGELRHALREAEQDSHVHVLILTGTGKAFSAGGDLRRMRESDIPPVERYEFIRHEFGGLIQEGST